jgi:group I intron endonuclease
MININLGTKKYIEILMKNTIILFNKNLPHQPVIIYNNADTERLQILKDNKGKSGLYLWTHRETGKRYVGSAVDLSKRLKNYYSPLKLKRADNYIARALLFHTHSAFSLTIIEFISIKDLSLEKARELILEREQVNINLLKPEYNILKVAGSLLGYKHTQESLTKISLSNLGKTHSVETVNKIKIALRGEKNPMSKNVLVYSFDLETKDMVLYKSFNTCIEAAKYFDCSTRNLSRYLDKNKLYKKQWILLSSLVKDNSKE